MTASTIQPIRTGPHDPAFRSLVVELDKDLAIRDGDEHAFFAQYNKLDEIKHVVLVMNGDQPAGCGALKQLDTNTVEIKRMFTAPAHRQQGIASTVLLELERWATQLGYTRCVLETGKLQPEAIALYTKHGYDPIPNYGPYITVESSLCFAKQLA